jgi:probable addiction module antidote protein
MKNKIILTDFRENFAKELRKNPKNLDYFIKDSVEQYEKDGDFNIFLENLRVAAMAVGMSKVSKKVKVTRDALYKSLFKEGNPSSRTWNALLEAVGIKTHYSYHPAR